MSQEIFAVLMIAALLWPLVLVLRQPLMTALTARGEVRFPLDSLWATAPLPALLLALLGADGSLSLSAWLLGGVWVLDESRRVLLAFTALLWLLSGWYARGYLAGERDRANAGNGAAASRLARFALLWPLTLSGNLLLLVAEDIASFYLGFAVMTFAAYGLVIHSGTRDALIGGRAYLIMAVLGEGLILGGLLWGVGALGTLTLSGLREGLGNLEHGVWIGVLLWLGFGVKAGVAGLHIWLPLAHPVAPTPASAVLSGAMIKAGLVGWMATLPLGESAASAFADLGRAMLVVGLVGAIGAALLGVCQRHPKAVLAYSSVSQLGMLAALVGTGLLAPAMWPALAPAVVLFAAHHGLTKGVLFLGVGIGEHPPRLPAWMLALLLTLPALSLAGVLGSGLATKWAFKAALYEGDHSALVTWLSLAAVGTTLLMARTLWCQWQGEGQARRDGLVPLAAPMPLAWLLLVVSALTLPLWLPALGLAPAWPPREELFGLWWPVLLGVALALLVGWLTRGRPLRMAGRRLPAGDLWWPLSRGLSRLWVATGPWLVRLAAAKTAWVAWWVALEEAGISALDALGERETWLRRHAAVLMMVVAVGLALALLFSTA